MDGLLPLGKLQAIMPLYRYSAYTRETKMYVIAVYDKEEERNFLASELSMTDCGCVAVINGLGTFIPFSRLKDIVTVHEATDPTVVSELTVAVRQLRLS